MAASTGDGSSPSDEQALPEWAAIAGPVEAEQHGLGLDAVDRQAHQVGQAAVGIGIAEEVHPVERRQAVDEPFGQRPAPGRLHGQPARR